MSRAAWYIIGIVIVVVLVGAAGELSVRSATCMACHQQEANFATWMSGRLKADNKGFAHELLGCADCHILGAPGKTMMSRFRGLLHVATYAVPQLDPRQERVSHLFTKTRVPTENCQYCHLAAQSRKAVYVKDLPPGLKQIGLQMDHHKHVLAREDTCARCHERYKNGSSVADRNVNYAEVNHLACDSCHSVASHAYRSELIMPISEQHYADARQVAWDTLATNPRWMIGMPSEKTCSRCHNGQIHFKQVIFLADCRVGKNYDNCLKCHPLMTRDYFDRYLKEREKTESASIREGDSSRHSDLSSGPFNDATAEQILVSYKAYRDGKRHKSLSADEQAMPETAQEH
jgi:hypothetical protein